MPNFDHAILALIALSFIAYTLLLVVLTFQVTGTNKKLKSLEKKFLSIATAAQFEECVAKLDKGFVDALLLSENNMTHMLDDIALNVKMLQKDCQTTVDTATIVTAEQSEHDKILAAVEYARSGYKNDQIVEILQLNADVVEEITKFNRSH